MKKILCVDDEVAMLQCLKAALASDGYESTCISRSEDVLAALHREKFDLVLLDVRMPGLSGIDIYNEFRKCNPVPVLFVTAFHRAFSADSESMIQLWKHEFADGTTDILYKPFEVSSLLDKVRALIGGPGDD